MVHSSTHIPLDHACHQSECSGLPQEQQHAWARAVHSLPSLRENAVMPDGGGDFQPLAFQGAASAADFQDVAHVYPAKVRHSTWDSCAHRTFHPLAMA